MGWDGNGTLRWKMGWEMAGLTDVLENGMENRKNKNGRTLVLSDLYIYQYDLAQTISLNNLFQSDF